MPELTDEQKAMTNIDYLFRKAKNDQPERILQKKICNHLQTYYPDVYFMSDPSGIKLSPNILKLLKATRSRHTQLDIVILEPSIMFKGLVLEVKAECPYKHNGELKSDIHLQEQNDVMMDLKIKGYHCEFIWDFNHAVRVLEIYLGKPKTDNTPLFPKTNIDPFSHEEI